MFVSQSIRQADTWGIDLHIRYKPVRRHMAQQSASRIRTLRSKFCFPCNTFHEIVTAVYKSADINICCPHKVKAMEMLAGRRRKASEINNWLLELTTIQICTTHTTIRIAEIKSFLIFQSDVKFRLRNSCMQFVCYYINMIYMFTY